MSYCCLSGEAGCFLYEGYTGPCCIRDHAWLYPWMSVLSGGYGTTRPTRPKDVNVLKHYAEAMLDNTGQEEITFSSLSSSDYQSLPELT